MRKTIGAVVGISGGGLATYWFIWTLIAVDGNNMSLWQPGIAMFAGGIGLLCIGLLIAFGDKL